MKRHRLLLSMFSALLVLHSFAQEITWEQTNGPSGGEVIDLYAGVDGAVFASFTCAAPQAGPCDGNIYRSLDYGKSWERISLEGSSGSVIGVNDDGDVFIILDNDYYRSVNNGDSWEPVPYPQGGMGSIIQGVGDTLFAGGGNLSMSVNNGQTWSVIDSSENYYIDINSMGDLVRAHDAGLQVSSDAGLTWSVINDLAAIGNYRALAIGELDEIFIGADNGLFRVSADGSSIEQLAGDFTSFEQVKVSSTGSIYAIADTWHFIKSDDNGVTWEVLNDEVPGSFEHFIGIDPEGIVYIGTEQRIYRSDDDGETWVNATNGVIQSNVFSLASDDSGNIYAATTETLFISTNRGNTWEELDIDNQLDRISKLLVADNGDVYLIARVFSLDPCAGDSCYHLLRSTNAGESWDIIFSSNILGDVEVDDDGTIIVTSNTGIMKSEDQGESWEAVSSELEMVLEFLLDRDEGLIYAVTSDQTFMSDDEGMSWTELTIPFFYSNDMVINSRGDLLLPGTSDGNYSLFISTDRGMTWNDITPIDSPYVIELLVGNYDQLHVFTDEGMYTSRDNGANWIDNGPLPNFVVAATDDPDGRLFVASYARGVWTSSTLVSTKNIPQAGPLLQVYPNPSRDNILVEHPGTSPGDMLRVYNSRGQQVKEVSIDQEATSVDISSLPRGIYLIKVGEATGKVVVY